MSRQPDEFTDRHASDVEMCARMDADLPPLLREVRLRGRRRRARAVVAGLRDHAHQQPARTGTPQRQQVAALAVKGAEQILRKEVNAGVHADLLNRLKAEL